MRQGVVCERANRLSPLSVCAPGMRPSFVAVAATQNSLAVMPRPKLPQHDRARCLSYSTPVDVALSRPGRACASHAECREPNACRPRAHARQAGPAASAAGTACCWMTTSRTRRSTPLTAAGERRAPTPAATRAGLGASGTARLKTAATMAAATGAGPRMSAHLGTAGMERGIEVPRMCMRRGGAGMRTEGTGTGRGAPGMGSERPRATATAGAPASAATAIQRGAESPTPRGVRDRARRAAQAGAGNGRAGARRTVAGRGTGGTRSIGSTRSTRRSGGSMATESGGTVIDAALLGGCRVWRMRLPAR